MAKCPALHGLRGAAGVPFAVVPSSAACERVFSLLDAIFGQEEKKTLFDYISGSLILNNNKCGDTW